MTNNQYEAVTTLEKQPLLLQTIKPRRTTRNTLRFNPTLQDMMNTREETRKHREATKIQAAFKKRKRQIKKERENKETAFLIIKEQRNKRKINTKLNKNANKLIRKKAFDSLKPDPNKKALKKLGNNFRKKKALNILKPFDPNPSYKPLEFPPGFVQQPDEEYEQYTGEIYTQEKNLEKHKNKLSEKLLELNILTDLENLVKYTLGEELSNDFHEVSNQIDEAIQLFLENKYVTETAATKIQALHRGKKNRKSAKLIKESRKMLGKLNEHKYPIQTQKLNLMKKRLVNNQLTKIMKQKATILGVDVKTMTKRNIERAYRKLSRMYHPNMKKGYNNKLLNIQKAKTFLIDYIDEIKIKKDTQALRNAPKRLALQYKPPNKSTPLLAPKSSQALPLAQALPEAPKRLAKTLPNALLTLQRTPIDKIRPPPLASKRKYAGNLTTRRLRTTMNVDMINNKNKMKFIAGKKIASKLQKRYKNKRRRKISEIIHKHLSDQKIRKSAAIKLQTRIRSIANQKRKKEEQILKNRAGKRIASKLQRRYRNQQKRKLEEQRALREKQMAEQRALREKQMAEQKKKEEEDRARWAAYTKQLADNEIRREQMKIDRAVAMAEERKRRINAEKKAIKNAERAMEKKRANKEAELILQAKEENKGVKRNEIEKKLKIEADNDNRTEMMVRKLNKNPRVKKRIENMRMRRKVIKRSVNPNIKKILNLKLLTEDERNENEIKFYLSKLSKNEKIFVRKILSDDSFVKAYKNTVPYKEKGIKLAKKAALTTALTAVKAASVAASTTASLIDKVATKVSDMKQQKEKAARQREEAARQREEAARENAEKEARRLQYGRAKTSPPRELLPNPPLDPPPEPVSDPATRPSPPAEEKRSWLWF
jgi:colicin import membrane protein